MNNTIQHIEQWMPKIRGLARKYKNIIASEEDLVNEGVLGLLRALRDFNPARAQLDTFIYKCIDCDIKIAALKNAYPVSCPPGTLLVNKQIKEREHRTMAHSVHLDSCAEDKWARESTTEELIDVLDLISRFDTKDIARQYFIDGYTCHEIAARTNVSPSFAWKVVDSVRDILRKELAR